jgi:murein DD-endopeptidase MepM/ murein hydrolase activator NlpD
VVPALALSFVAGIAAGWWLRSGAPLPVAVDIEGRETPSPALRASGPAPSRGEEGGRAPAVAATTGEPLIGPGFPSAAGVLEALRTRHLRLPIEGASVDAMKGSFTQRRSGGRAHEAVDLLAPRNTPVHAVDDGSVAKLFTSAAGGITVYQFDPTKQFCYYYAHLERYAPGLRDGQPIARGDVIGYVGTTGNAPPNTPHLHFAIFELDADHRWWKGRAIDPYLIFKG